MLAVAIVLVDNPGVWIISGAVCLAAVVAFLASRTVGLPEIGDDVGDWTEPLGIPAVASEVLLVVLASAHVRRMLRVGRRDGWSGPAGFDSRSRPRPLGRALAQPARAHASRSFLAASCALQL